MIKILNEDCFETMKNTPAQAFDIILTSPFYNTNKKAGKNRNLSNAAMGDGRYEFLRYDVHVDNMTDTEYTEYTVKLFKEFDRVLNTNGCVIYNINYGAENTEGLFKAINGIITQSEFTIADVICWKKTTAFPNSCSSNKLTRIWEFIFVFCRKHESKTFNCNKRITSYRKTGQAAYENIYNFIEAKNNDESCPYNKATFSTDLVKKLLQIYATDDTKVIYDPFMGSGTTAVACQDLGLCCVGSEISAKQCEWARERLSRCVNA